MKRLSLLVLIAGCSLAQSFEVASIRQTDIDLRKLVTGGAATTINLANVGMKVNGNQVTFGFTSLRDLIVMAYEVKPTQLTGPEWLAQQRYDITALMPEGADAKQIPVMLQALLKERFKLVAHKDSKEQTVFALEVAKGGHKMKEAAPLDSNATPPAPAPGAQTTSVGGQTISINRSSGGATAMISTAAGGAMKMSMGQDGQMHLEVARMTMQQLADQLTPLAEFPVVDRTGLPGTFQVTLDLPMADIINVVRRNAGAAGIALPAGAAPQGMPAGLGASDPTGDLSSTVAKLGLRLEKTKLAMDSVTVESAEKTPTEN